MARTAAEFVRRDVVPYRTRLEAHDDALLRALFTKAGALGLLAANVPAQCGGLELPKTVSALLCETLGSVDLSFAIGAGVHSGVALLPLVQFGTDEQKQAFLPRMASGELIGAFALSEANAGSDARAAQTTAVLSPDGAHYTVSGAKQWVTNAGVADVFTVFVQVNGTEFTALLIEKNMAGVSLGPEENKMGLRASSTRRLHLDSVHVPVQNVIGEVSRGHLPALHALNPGRLGIAATAVGSAKDALRMATMYVRNRSQFGRTLSSFPLVRSQLATMAARTFAAVAFVYYVAAQMDAGTFGANEEAAACALLKVYATDAQAFVVDEALQLHGGYGFSESFPVARAYRDARVFRIFEGANDVVRLSAAEQAVKGANAGRFALIKNNGGDPLAELAAARLEEFTSLPDAERRDAQELSVSLAELLADALALQSVTARAQSLYGSRQQLACLARDIVQAEAYTRASLGITDTTRARRALGDAVLQCGGNAWD